MSARRSNSSSKTVSFVEEIEEDIDVDGDDQAMEIERGSGDRGNSSSAVAGGGVNDSSHEAGDGAGNKGCGCPHPADAIVNGRMKTGDMIELCAMLLILGVSIWGLLMRKLVWVQRQWGQKDDGHLVSKFVVILFCIHMYGVVKLAWEVLPLLKKKMAGAGRCECEICPNIESALEHFRISRNTFACLQRFGRICSNSICISMSFLLGRKLWDAVWVSLVCKGYNDRSCTGTTIGLMLYNYKKYTCYDGKTHYAMCEKFVAIIPLVVLTIGIIVANVVCVKTKSTILKEMNPLHHGTVETDDANDGMSAAGNTTRHTQTPARESVPKDGIYGEVLNLDSAAEILDKSELGAKDRPVTRLSASKVKDNSSSSQSSK